MGRAERRWAPGPPPAPAAASPRLPVRLVPVVAVSEKGAEPPTGGGGLKGPGAPLQGEERRRGQRWGKLRQGWERVPCLGGGPLLEGWLCLSFPALFPPLNNNLIKADHF